MSYLLNDNQNEFIISIPNHLFNIQGPRGLDGPPGELGTEGIKVSVFIAQYYIKH